jgi:hypothetical protein
MYGGIPEPTKANRPLIDAFIKTALETGEDGKGKGGITGYFKRMARRDPMQMAQFLGKALRWPSVAADEGEGIVAAMKAKYAPEKLVRLSLWELSALYSEMIQDSNMLWATRKEATELSPLAQGILEGAASVGENGIGKNGLPGYLKQLQRRHPRAMAKALGKVLAFPAEPSAKETEYKPTEEEMAAHKKRLEEGQAALERAREEYEAELKAKRADGDSPDP